MALLKCQVKYCAFLIFFTPIKKIECKNLTGSYWVYVAAKYNDFLINFARENKHYVCDAASALAPGFENFYDDCHFNTQGARNMSVVVAKCLEDVLLSGNGGEYYVLYGQH